jgi:hypothetical protein
MDIIGLLAKQYGFRPIFAWYPNLAVGHKQLTPYESEVLRLQYEQFPDLGAMYQSVYKRGSEIKRPDFYDLEDVVDDQSGSLYVGISHMKPEGDQIVANRLVQIIESTRKIEGARPQIERCWQKSNFRARTKVPNGASNKGRCM